MTNFYVTCIIRMSRDSFICDMTHSYVTWLIHMCHNSFICERTHSYVTWLIICDMTHSNVTWHMHMQCDSSHTSPRQTLYVARRNNSCYTSCVLHMILKYRCVSKKIVAVTRLCSKVRSSYLFGQKEDPRDSHIPHDMTHEWISTLRENESVILHMRALIAHLTEADTLCCA